MRVRSAAFLGVCFLPGVAARASELSCKFWRPASRRPLSLSLRAASNLRAPPPLPLRRQPCVERKQNLVWPRLALRFFGLTVELVARVNDFFSSTRRGACHPTRVRTRRSRPKNVYWCSAAAKDAWLLTIRLCLRVDLSSAVASYKT
ncbi:hypothetical protein MRX96_000087 [Rhipicephalus microplus]